MYTIVAKIVSETACKSINPPPGGEIHTKIVDTVRAKESVKGNQTVGAKETVEGNQTVGAKETIGAKETVGAKETIRQRGPHKCPDLQLCKY